MAGNRGIVAQGLGDPNTTPLTAGALPEFRFVYFEQAVAKGECQQWSDTAGLLGVGVEDPASNSYRVAGVAAQTVAAAGWGWIQTAGYCDYIITDEGVAVATDIAIVAIDTETCGGATAANLNSVAATGGALAAFGFPLADDADTVGTVILSCHYQ